MTFRSGSGQTNKLVVASEESRLVATEAGGTVALVVGERDALGQHERRRVVVVVVVVELHVRDEEHEYGVTGGVVAARRGRLLLDVEQVLDDELTEQSAEVLVVELDGLLLMLLHVEVDDVQIVGTLGGVVTGGRRRWVVLEAVGLELGKDVLGRGGKGPKARVQQSIALVNERVAARHVQLHLLVALEERGAAVGTGARCLISWRWRDAAIVLGSGSSSGRNRIELGLGVEQMLGGEGQRGEAQRCGLRQVACRRRRRCGCRLCDHGRLAVGQRSLLGRRVVVCCVGRRRFVCGRVGCCVAVVVVVVVRLSFAAIVGVVNVRVECVAGAHLSGRVEVEPIVAMFVVVVSVFVAFVCIYIGVGVLIVLAIAVATFAPRRLGTRAAHFLLFLLDFYFTIFDVRVYVGLVLSCLVLS